MNIEELLSREKRIVDQALETYLPESGKPEIITHAMRYSLFAGGKRIRPILIFSSYRTVGGKKRDSILPAACAVEMIHTYSLIHDDLPAMDNDDFRRGKPSCHKKFNEAIAILAGDALFAKSFEILQKTKTSKEKLHEVNKTLSSAVGTEGIIGGQVMDIVSTSDDNDKDLLKYIHTHKTGKFISACLVIGGILGDAYKDEIKGLRKAGDILGLTFQIVDDILDVKGTKEKVGKTVQKDEKCKKLTYPSLFGLEESIEITKKNLQKIKNIFKTKLKFRDTTELIKLSEFIVERVY
jgi:geranylgeranyl diphosphate synthase type II